MKGISGLNDRYLVYFLDRQGSEVGKIPHNVVKMWNGLLILSKYIQIICKILYVKYYAKCKCSNCLVSTICIQPVVFYRWMLFCVPGLSLGKHQLWGTKPSSCRHPPACHMPAQFDAGLYTHSCNILAKHQWTEEQHKYVSFRRSIATIPLFSIEDGKDMFTGHEALLHVSQLQVVQRQHVLLLFLLIEHPVMINIKRQNKPKQFLGTTSKILLSCGT